MANEFQRLDIWISYLGWIGDSTPACEAICVVTAVLIFRGITSMLFGSAKFVFYARHSGTEGKTDR